MSSWTIDKAVAKLEDKDADVRKAALWHLEKSPEAVAQHGAAIAPRLEDEVAYMRKAALVQANAKRQRRNLPCGRAETDSAKRGRGADSATSFIPMQQPLAAACVDVAGLLVQELIVDIAQSCKAVPVPPAHAFLLEGLGELHATASPKLRALIAEEAEAMKLAEAEASAAVSYGAGIFSAKKNPSELLLCANCDAQVAVHRFAPHLEKCMLGKGRASARAARNSMIKQTASEQRRRVV